MKDELHSQIASLRRYAFVLCRNRSDADDLVQDTLLKAIASAHTYRKGRSLRAWLCGILHNTFVSHRRQYARRARAAAFLESLSGDAGSAAEQERYIEAKQTLTMLGRLTPDQQSAITLIAIEGFSYAEAAESLDIPVGTLMSRLSRGREQLRRLMAGDDVRRPRKTG